MSDVPGSQKNIDEKANHSLASRDPTFKYKGKYSMHESFLRLSSLQMLVDHGNHRVKKSDQFIIVDPVNVFFVAYVKSMHITFAQTSFIMFGFQSNHQGFW